MQIFNIILFWFFFGAICAHFSKKRGRRPVLWFFLGMGLGLFGVLLLFILPKIERRASPPPPKFQPQPRQTELWFYLDRDHGKHGPLSFPDFNHAWKEAKFSSENFVWSEGMEQWKPLTELPEVMKDLTQTAKIKTMD